MLLFKRDDITYVSIPIIEPRLHCVRVKKNKKTKNKATLTKN